MSTHQDSSETTEYLPDRVHPDSERSTPAGGDIQRQACVEKANSGVCEDPTHHAGKNS